jgi:hypothetical protein
MKSGTLSKEHSESGLDVLAPGIEQIARTSSVQVRMVLEPDAAAPPKMRRDTGKHKVLTLWLKFSEHFIDSAVYLAEHYNGSQTARRTGPKVGASPSIGTRAPRPPHARTPGPADRRPGASASGSTQGRLRHPFARGIGWSSTASIQFYNKRLWQPELLRSDIFTE